MRNLIAFILVLAANTSVFAACSTHTYNVNGKYISCTTCCYYGNCNTNCY
jgi:hypothetical protein